MFWHGEEKCKAYRSTAYSRNPGCGILLSDTFTWTIELRILYWLRWLIDANWSLDFCNVLYSELRGTFYYFRFAFLANFAPVRVRITFSCLHHVTLNPSSIQRTVASQWKTAEYVLFKSIFLKFDDKSALTNFPVW